MLGIVCVNKPQGWTSYDVVNKLKRIYNTGKIGHLGTLDPMAEGVLPVAIGKATKLFDFYLKKSKKYIAEFEFGYETDTLDKEGKIINETDRIPSLANIEAVLPKLTGKIMQIPPRYSAIKINGKRAYDLARNNIDFEPIAKEVLIKSINCLGECRANCFKFEIECSAGTYIRSIARDMAKELNSLATMVSLVRTRSGNFRLEEAKTIDDIIKNPSECLIPLEEVLGDLPKIEIPDKKVDLVKNGVKIALVSGEENQISTIYLNGLLFGIGMQKNGKLEMIVRLN